MDILETKILEKEVNDVEVLGVISKFHGNIAGIISNQNGRECNVVITYDLKEIKPEDYVLPTMINRETAEKLYNNLR